MDQLTPTPPPTYSKMEAKQRRRYAISMGTAGLYQVEFEARQALLIKTIKQVCQQLLKGTTTPLDIIMYASRLQQDKAANERILFSAEDACEAVFKLIETNKITANDLFENRLLFTNVQEAQAVALREMRESLPGKDA